MVIIYHNPRCSKSRAGINYLEENNIEYKIRPYLAEPFTSDELRNLIAKTGMPPEDLVRKHEDYYKKELKGKTFSDEEWIDILVKNPRLLHRPIVENEGKAVWAQPPDKIQDIL